MDATGQIQVQLWEMFEDNWYPTGPRFFKTFKETTQKTWMILADGAPQRIKSNNNNNNNHHLCIDRCCFLSLAGLKQVEVNGLSTTFKLQKLQMYDFFHQC